MAIAERDVEIANLRHVVLTVSRDLRAKSLELSALRGELDIAALDSQRESAATRIRAASNQLAGARRIADSHRTQSGGEPLNTHAPHGE